MGTIVRRKKKGGAVSFRAVVRKAGVQKTKSFTKLTLARKWITDTEYAIEHRAAAGQAHTLAELVRKFRTQIVANLPYKRGTAISHLKMLEKRTKDVFLHTMTPEWWIDFARGFSGVSPGTRQQYVTYISRVLTTAEELWDVTVDWASFRRARRLMKRFGLIGKGKARERRTSEEELALVKSKIRSSLPISDLIDFAVDSAMREDEICRLRWSDYDRGRRMIVIRDRKHPKEKIGNDWTVPLLGRTVEIIERQPRIEGMDFIFPYNPGSVGAAFRRARDRGGVKDLRFHDLRHEGISRLFEAGYQIQEVALVSGHLDWSSLKIYTQLKPHGLHDGPVARRVLFSPELLSQLPPELLTQLQKAA